MFGDFLTNNRLIEPANYCSIVRGTPMVAFGLNTFQFGIYDGSGIVIAQIYHFENNNITFPIKAISFNNFCRGCYLYEYTPQYTYDKNETYERAISQLNIEYNEIRSAYGDDFVFMCMVGQENFFHAFKNSKMGYHYKTYFPLNFIVKAEHHAIAIEGGYVIHFSRGAGADKTEKPVIRLDEFNVLKKASNNKLQKVEYTHDDFNNLFQARCRATWVLAGMLDFETYQLFTNNCEHFACWCKTGYQSSTQLKQGLVDLAVILGSAALKIPNPLMINALRRHLNFL